MQRSESSCSKRARMLSLNQIREIVMDSDSDEVQYNSSGTEDEEMEPRPPYKNFPFHRLCPAQTLLRARTITGRLTVMTDYGK